MVDPGPPRPPRLVAKALGTGAIPAKLSAILADRFRTVREDGESLSLEKRLVRGVHSFLAQLKSVVEIVPRLEQVTLVRINSDVMLHLMHLVLSVWVDMYSTSRHIFACLGELTAEGLPPVVETPHKAF